MEDKSKKSTEKSTYQKDIAIVGISCRFPGSPDVETFWHNLSQGVDSIEEIGEDRWGDYSWYHPDRDHVGTSHSRWAGFIKDSDKFDPLFFGISPKEAKIMDPQQRVFLEESWKAFEDAGYPPRNLKQTNVGVFVGVAAGDYQQLLQEHGVNNMAEAFTGTSQAILAGRISFFLNLNGPVLAVDTACSSSLVAIDRACKSLILDECDMALAGGVNLMTTPQVQIWSSKNRMASPDGRCKSFDENANGIVVGEGVGAIIMKRLEDAERDGDRIYAVIKGSGINQNGRTKGITVPSQEAQSNLGQEVYRKYAIDPSTITYVEANGTGTRKGDPIELKALEDSFRNYTNEKQYCALGSVKTNIGHLAFAGGVAGLIKVILMMKHRQYVPSLHFNEPNSLFDFERSPFYVNTELKDWKTDNDKPRQAAISSFGFSGTNAHMVLEEYIQETTHYENEDPAIILLSAKSEERLKKQASNLSAYLKANENVNLYDVAYMLQIGREPMEERLAFITNSIEELLNQLENYQDDKTEGLLTGNVKKSESDFLLKEGVEQTDIDRAIKNKEIEALIQLWISGAEIDWHLLYEPKNRPDKITLPAYPFKRKRYWCDNYTSSISNSNAKVMTNRQKPFWDMISFDTLSKHKVGDEVQLKLSTDGIGIIRLNAPATRNMLDETLIKSLQKTFLELRERKTLKVVIITGYDNIFCMGGSQEILEDIADQKSQFTDAPFLYRGLLEFDVPVISAIQGHAVGGGLLFGLYGDIVLMNEESTYTANFMQYGFTPGMGATYILGEKLGKQLATEMMYTARLMSGKEIKERGASVIVTKDVLQEALHIAKDLSGKPKKALQVLKKSMSGQILSELLLRISEEEQMHGETFHSKEVKDRITEQFEKSSPIDEKHFEKEMNEVQSKMRMSELEIEKEQKDIGQIILEDVSSSVSSHTSQAKSLPLEEDKKEMPEQRSRRTKVAINKEAVVDQLKLIFGNALHISTDELDGDETFVDLGVDSISGLEIVRIVNETFSLSLETVVLYDRHSIDKLAELIVQESGYTFDDNIIGTKISGSPKTTKKEQNSESNNKPDSTLISNDKPSTSMEKSDPDKKELQEQNEKSDDIAIIGMSGRFPEAKNVDIFWENLKKGKNSISEIPSGKWDISQLYSTDKAAPGKSYSKWMGSVEDEDMFDALFFNISPREAERMDPQQRLFLEESWKAIEDAGYNAGNLEGEKWGVFVGACEGDYNRKFNKNEIDNHIFTGRFTSILAARISYYLNLQGPAVAIDTACSSSLVAIHQACMSIMAGESELALAGGVYISTTEEMHVMTSKTSMLSEDGRCYTFDQRANGFVPGEAVAVLVLKSLKKAEADGDRIYGLIKSSGINQDGKTNGIIAPNYTSQARLETEVYNKSKISSDTITYVEAHGTGTKLGDPIEIKALKMAFKETADKHKTNYCGIGSVKTNIGHTLTAAGVSGMIKILLQFKHKQIAPTINYERLNEHINLDDSPFYINAELKDWETENNQVRRAAVSSFGFSGTNSHIVLEEYVGREKDFQSNESAIILLSAKNKERLKEQVSNLYDHIRGTESLNLHDIAFTLQIGRKPMEERLACVVENVEDLSVKLSNYLAGSTEGFVIGNSKKDKRAFLQKEEASESYIAKAIRNRDLESLALIWTKGISIDWKSLYDEGNYPNKISLPTYPFDRQRYWIPESENVEFAISKNKLHPLLHSNESDLSEQRFMSTFTGSETFLSHHKVGEEKVLPGVAQIELAREAGVRSLRQEISQFKDVKWLSPIKVKDVSADVQINLFEDEKTTGYEIYGISGEDRVIYSEGKLSTKKLSPPSSKDIDLIKNRLGKQKGREECYEIFKNTGLHYGTSFLGIETIYYSEYEALSKITLPKESTYALQPGIMDSALQTCIGLSFEQESTLSLPFSVKEVNIYGDVSQTGWSHVRKSANRRDEVYCYDVDLLSETGEVLLSFKDFIALPISSFRVGHKPNLQERKEEAILHLYTSNWEETSISEQIDPSDIDQVILLVGDTSDLAEELEKSIAKEVITISEKTEVEYYLTLQNIIQSRLDRKGKMKLTVVYPNEDYTRYGFISGLLKTAQFENPNFIGQTIGVDVETQCIASLHPPLPQILKTEHHTTDPEIRHINGKRQTKEISKLIPEQESQLPAIKEGGVYLITGGAGGLGKIFAEHISKTPNTKIILTGRRGDITCYVPTASYYSCDVTDKESTENLIKNIINKYGKLNGIIHSAGILRDSFLQSKTEEEATIVLSPKILGAINLDDATKDIDLDFIIYFSSLAGVLGNMGQADYASANAWLDNHAHHRNDLKEKGKRKGFTLSINWPLWKEGGMQIDTESEKFMERKWGISALPTDEGVTVMEMLLQQGRAQGIVAYGKPSIIGSKLFIKKEIHNFNEKDSDVDNHLLREKAEQFILGLVSKILKLDVSQLSTDEEIGDYGFDSIMMTKFANELNDYYGIDLLPTTFYNYPTIEGLSEYLVTEYTKALSAKHPLTSPSANENKDSINVSVPITSHTSKREKRSIKRKVVSRSEQPYNFDEPIAIIGMSGRFPGSPNLDIFWENIKANKDLISEVPTERWDWRAYYGDPKEERGKTNAKWGGFISDIDKFDPMYFNISPREAGLMDPQQRIILEATYHALEDACISPQSIKGSNTGVFIGVSSWDYSDLISKNSDKAGLAQFATGNTHSVLVNRISYLLDIHGPSEPINTACSSSLIAIHRAAENIRNGHCNLAIVGGVNALLSPQPTISFSQAGMLSEDGRCKTFDQSANGYVRAEGIGVVILKPLSQAEADGDPIHAIIRSTAENHGGKANTLTSPNPNAQKALLLKAYQSADISPWEVSYIEAHGTGTSLGDPIETEALKSAFKTLYNERNQELPTEPYTRLGSVKTKIGHLEAAAGIAGILKVVQSLKHKIIPGNPHLNTPNAYLALENSPFQLQKETTAWETKDNIPRIAGISSFGFGGANAHVVLEEYTRIKKDFQINAPAIILLSAKNKEQLRAHVTNLNTFLKTEKALNLHDVAYTLQIGRQPLEERLAFIVNDIEKLRSRLNAFLQGKKEDLLTGNIKKDNGDFILKGSTAKQYAEIALRDKDLGSLAQLWVKGVTIDWNMLYENGDYPNKISLPKYPFERKRFWYDSFASAPIVSTNAVPKKVVTESLWDTITLDSFFDHIVGEEVQYKLIDGGIAIVQLNARETKNMFDSKLVNSLQKTFLTLRQIRDLKTVIVTGYDNIFCMGGSQETLENIANKKSRFTDVPFLYRGLLEFDVPVISAIQGHAFGGGMLFGLYGDIVLMDEESTYTANFMKYGFTPGMGATYILGEKLGKQLAAEMMYTADLISGKEIKERGASVIITKEVFKEALHIAKKLSAKPRKSLEVLKANMSGHILSELLVRISEEEAMHAETFHNEEVKARITMQFESPAIPDQKEIKKDVENGISKIQLSNTGASQIEKKEENTGKIVLDEILPLVVHPTAKTINLPVEEKKEAIPIDNKKRSNGKVSKLTIMDQLKSLFEAVLHIPASELDEEGTFVDLGLDSISGMEVMRSINKTFSLSLETVELYNYHNLNKLSNLIEKESNWLEDQWDDTESIVENESVEQEQDQIIVKEQKVSVENSVKPDSPSIDQLLTSLERNGAPDVSKKSVEPHEEKVSSNEIAIIGISGRFPKAKDVDTFWANLREGKNCISEVPSRKWEIDQYYSPDKNVQAKSYSKWVGSLEDEDKFDTLFFNISPMEAQRMDPQQRLFLEESWKAIEDAGYNPDDLAGTKCGVFVGVGTADYLLRFDEEKMDNLTFTGVSTSILAARISYYLDLQGPAVSVDTACSSSLVTIHQACQSINAGESETALAGGVYVMTGKEMHVMTSKAGMLSEDGRCYTFDQRANGFVPGEAVGVLLLKSLEQAEKDGDRIYGVIKSSGINQDGKTNGITAPNFESQARLETEVYNKSKISPDTITYVEAHGTGTKLGDPIEVKALKMAFKQTSEKDKTGYCGLGSVKSNIGHTLTAAGVSGVIKVLLQLKHKQIAPTINYEQLNEHINLDDSPFYINTELKDWKTEDNQPRRAAVSSFGFSGTNAHIVLEEYINQPGNYKSKDSAIILLSAKNSDRLKEQASNLKNYLNENEVVNLYDVAYTLQVGRNPMEERLVFMVDNVNELINHLNNYLDGKTDGILQGNIKRDKGDLLLDDETRESSITNAINEKAFETLAQLWVNGAAIDWNLLYETNNRPNKISLPVYPFARERYWLPVKDEHSISNGVSKLHPLLHLNESDLHKQRFTSFYTGKESFLTDHKVREKKVLPGVAYLELAREAGERSIHHEITQLRDIAWLRPVVVDDQVKIHIELNPDGEEIKYEVYSENETQRIVHNQGKLSAKKLTTPEQYELEAIKKRLKKSMEGKSCYDLFKNVGLNYGKSFQGMETLYYSDEEALSKITLPKEAFVLQPGVLDSALQTCIGLNFENVDQDLALPFGVKEVNIYGDVQKTCWAYARKSMDNKSDNRVNSYDIDLLSETGEVLLRFKDFTTLPLNGLEEKEKEETSLHLFTNTWEESAISDQVNYSEYDQIVLLTDSLTDQVESLRESFDADVQAIDETIEIDFYNKVQKIIQSKLGQKNKTKLTIVYPNQDYTKYNFISGLLKTAQIENPNFIGQTIGVSVETQCIASLHPPLPQILQTEQNTTDPEIKYTNGKRQTKKISKLSPEQEPQLPAIKEGGVYLITGGTGGLGKIFADHISKTPNTQIILTGRGDVTCYVSSTTSYYQCDVTDKKSTEKLIGDIITKHGKLNGIIHSAGILRDSFLQNKTEKEAFDVLAPKILGVKYLDEATKETPLDFMIFFSSMAGVTGNPGQADYAAANAYMDNYILYRNTLREKGQRHGKTVSINWPLWKEGGMHVDVESQKYLEKRWGQQALPTKEGLAAFETLLSDKIEHGQCLVTYGKESKIVDKLTFKLNSNKASLDIDTSDLKQKVLDKILGQISNILNLDVEHIATDEELGDYGFDSISLTKFANELNDYYDLDVIPTTFYNYPTVESLVNFLVEEHAGNLAKRHETKLIENFVEIPHKNPLQDKQEIRNSRFIQDQNQQKTSDYSSMQYSMEPIAIVGISGRFPGSPDLDTFWNNLKENKDLITEIPADRWDWKQYYGDPDKEDNKTKAKWGGFIEDIDKFDPLFFNISPREAELMDPQQRITLEAVYTALEDAGIATDTLKGSNTGVFIGVSGSDYSILVNNKTNLAGQAQFSTGSAHSVLVNRISYLLDIHGPSEPIDTACSSSLIAVHRAVENIRLGHCDMAITGGVNAILSPELTLSFSQAGMLSEDGRCKTFDEGANGYVRGEGVGMIILKSLNKAKMDGDHIYGMIRGTAENHGGKANTLTSPNPNAQKDLLLKAYRSAGVKPEDVTYIEAHGTGTHLGDPIETEGLKLTFKELYRDKNLTFPEKPYCSIGSVKTNIGHLESAAGIASLIKVILSLKHETLPGNAHLENPNKYLKLDSSPFYLQKETSPWTTSDDKARIAGISSFGFGGANAHVIIEEYSDSRHNEQLKIGNNQLAGQFIIPLSARNEERLKVVVQNLLDHLNHKSPSADSQLTNIAYTLQTGRQPMESRLAIVAKDNEELIQQLTHYLEGKTEKLFIGNVKKDKTDFLLKGEAGNAYIQKAIEAKETESLAQLWVKGVDIDWDLFYPDQKPFRISLPTYPFEKGRYWIPVNDRKEETSVNNEKEYSEPTIKIDANTEEEDVVNTIAAYLKDKIAEATKLSVDKLDIHEDIQNYGFDSLLINKLNGDLESIIGKKDPALFFSSKSIHELAVNIEKKYRAPFTAFISGRTETKYKNTSHLQAKRTIESNGIRPSSKTRDVAIIGISGKYPQSEDLSAFFENLKKGKDCIEEIPAERWDYSKYYSNGNGTKQNGKIKSKWGGFISGANNFDHEHFNISLHEAVMLHPEERLLLEQAWHCFENAGYNPLNWRADDNKEAVGVYIGGSFHEYQHIVSESNRESEKYLPFTTQTYSYANRLSYYFNLRGPSVTLDTACSSSLYAIYTACTDIRSGNCDLALAGGVNLNLHPSKFILLSEYNFMASDGRCRAFAEGGDGYVPGEGIGLVLLKELEAAERDNDNILAVIKGISAGNDGKTNGFTVPNPKSQSSTIHRALKDGNIDPETLSMIECHGTGTSLGDPIEISALTDTFSDYTDELQYCAVSSVKSNIGHLEAAAGIAQITKVVLQLKNKIRFPNVMHSDRLNTNIQFADTPFYVQKELDAWENETDKTPLRAGISSFGAGGTNVHMILEAYTQSEKEVKSEDKDRYYIFPFSADSKEQLYVIIDKTYKYLSSKTTNIFGQEFTLENIASVLQKGRAEQDYRLAIICKGDLDDLLQQLKLVKRSGKKKKTSNSDQIIYGFSKEEVDLTRKGSNISQEETTFDPTNKKAIIKIAEHWTKGGTVDWNKFSKLSSKVVLPGYPFKAKHIDLNAYRLSQKALPANGTLAIKTVDSKEDLINLILNIFKKVMGELPDSFNNQKDFAHYGIDSITGSRVHNELIRYYEGLDDFVLLEHSTVDKLADHIYSQYPETFTKDKKQANHVPSDDKDAVGSIGDLYDGHDLSENEIIPFKTFVKAYKASKGKQKLKTKKVKIRDSKTIELITAGEGEPLFFLLPFNTTAIIWINQLLYFSKHYKVIILHYPGIGESDWIDELKSFDDLAKVITEVIDALVKKKFIKTKKLAFVGWSFGGFLAQTIAQKHSNYVKSLSLISTTTISWSSKEYQISGEEFSIKAAAEFEENYKKLPLFIRKMPVIRKMHEKGETASFVLGTSDQTVINRYFLMIARFRHLDTADKIKCKTFLISGSDDELMPAKFARSLHKKIKNSVYYEVKGGKHFMSLFDRKVINEELYGWFERNG